jgi:hypothetical protein
MSQRRRDAKRPVPQDQQCRYCEADQGTRHIPRPGLFHPFYDIHVQRVYISVNVIDPCQFPCDCYHICGFLLS